MNGIKFKNDNRADKFSTKLSLICNAILSIPKTIYFNLRCFPLNTAIKMPVLISHKVKLVELHRGLISFKCCPSRFMIKIGFGGSDAIIERKGLVCLEGGNVVFTGKASFSAGISIRNSGELLFGNNFWANKNCTIWCSKAMTFGDDVLLGWNIVFRDSDGHLILDNGIPKSVDGEISIGNHCWICSEAHVLKESRMGNDCVLGYGSLLTHYYESDNILYVGRPARPIKENINWLRGE